MRITTRNLKIMLKRSLSRDYYDYNYMMNDRAIVELVDYLEEDPVSVIDAIYRLGFMQGKRSSLK